MAVLTLNRDKKDSSLSLVKNRKPLSYYENDMDYWANGVNGIDLETSKGSGGILKGFSCVDLVDDTYLQSNYGFYMNDLDAEYEYYFEFILDDINQGSISLFYSYQHGISFQMRDNGVWVLYLVSSTGTYAVNGTVLSWLVVGLNKIKITFNTGTEAYNVTINENVREGVSNVGHDFSHPTAGFFRIGYTYLKTPLIKPIYLKISKDAIVTNEFIFSELTLNGDYHPVRIDYEDLVGDTHFYTRGTVDGDLYQKRFTIQEYINPFKNGYDLYWDQGTLDYLRVSPKNVLGVSKNPDNIDLFYSVGNGKIGYHVFEYIELPNLPIFDTSDRTYWKSSIESDDHYVGGVSGKERYFHKIWFDNDWINLHIEEEYRNLFFVKQTRNFVDNQVKVIVEISDIVLFNRVDISNLLNKYSKQVNLGNYYISKIVDYGRVDTAGHFLLFATRDSKRVMKRDTKLCFSSDAGKTWNTGIEVSTINTLTQQPISSVRILKNGNILVFSVSKELLYSDDNLETLTPCTLLESNSDSFAFHTPVNASYPGGYFTNFSGFVEDDGLLIFGNYTNGGWGASPIIIWYSIDNGITWKVVYEFGQNLVHRDDGTSIGGSTGTLLGDASNDLVCRHIHGINIGYDGNYYVCTGDKGSNDEMNFLKLIYDFDEDSWTIIDLFSGIAKTWQRLRGIGVLENDGYIYWGADGTEDTVVDDVRYISHGVYRALVSDLEDITKHELLLDLPDECYAFLRMQGDVVVAGLDEGQSNIYFSTDRGLTWEVKTLLADGLSVRPIHFDTTNKYLLTLNQFVIEYLI